MAVKPPLKWAGNKVRVMPELLKHLPEGKRLVEPFWAEWEPVKGADGIVRSLPRGYGQAAYGLSHRVERLRGYGNAIVPQVASGFISAFIESAAEAVQ